MAERRVTYLIGANVQNFMRGVNKAQKTFRRFGHNMQRIGSTMTRNVSIPLGIVGAASIKAAADFEKLQVQLNTLTGSAEAGAEAFENLKKFSARTPFQLQDLVKANNTLMGFGLSAQQSFQHLQTLGDIAAVTGGDLQSIAVAFGQSAAEGRLMTKDIRQLINQGVPAIKLLSESMGVAQDQVLDLASDGEITFDVLVDAFQKATAAGGQFEGGTDKLSKTLYGLFSTLRDNLTIALGDIGTSMVETFDIHGLIKRATAGIQTFIDWFTSLSQNVRQKAFIIAGILGVSGPIIAALGALSLAIGTISAPVAGIAVAVGAAAALIISHWDTLKAYFTSGPGAELFSNLKAIVQQTIGIISSLWNAFGENIVGFTKGAFYTVIEVIRTVLEGIANAIAIFTDVYTGKFENVFADTEDLFRDHFGNLKNIVKTGLLALREIDIIGGYKLWELLGLIPTQKELNQQYADRMKGAVEAARRATVIKPEHTIIEADIRIPELDADIGGKRMFVIEGIDRAKALLKSFGTSTKNLAVTYTGSLADMKAAGNDFRSTTEIALDGVTKKAVILSETLQSTVVSAVDSFATTLANAFTGDAGAQGFFNNLLVIVADFANQFGKMLIAAGAAALAFKKLLINPIAAIATGAALIVASTAVKSLLQEGPQAQGMAMGGIVPQGFPNDTYPAMLSSGETVVPAPKSLSANMGKQDIHLSGDFRVKGTDLVLSLERAKRSYR